LESLDGTFFDFDDPERERKPQDRFAGPAEEMQRIPVFTQDHYWSERSFCGASLAI
jgi:hypothetical protein